MQPSERAAPDVVVPVIEERVEIDRRVEDTGAVRVRKHVEQRTERVQVPLRREEISIERVPIGRYVDAPPGNRVEGDVLVVPLVEEVVETRRRLFVREELRIRKTLETTTSEPEDVVLRREDVVVERDGDGETPSR